MNKIIFHSALLYLFVAISGYPLSCLAKSFNYNRGSADAESVQGFFEQCQAPVNKENRHFGTSLKEQKQSIDSTNGEK